MMLEINKNKFVLNNINFRI